MRDIAVVDAHVHLWDPGRLRYPWLAGVPRLNRPHMLDGYRAAAAGVNVTKMVFLQCEADFSLFREEVAWVAEQAAQDSRIRAIVAWAPLEKGAAARADLEALAGCPLVRGVRRIIQFEKDDGFCLRPDFVRGVRLLREFGMSFDICIKGDAQFGNALQLVRACPDVRFILDHIGKPFIKEKLMEPWATHLRALAAMPNTWCKISGLVNEADWEHWQPADLRPYMDRVFGCFGFERVIFGGDWPVCTLASPYRRWFETLLDAVKGCSDAERRGLFHDNGARFYKIQEGGRT